MKDVTTMMFGFCPILALSLHQLRMDEYQGSVLNYIDEYSNVGFNLAFAKRCSVYLCLLETFLFLMHLIGGGNYLSFFCEPLKIACVASHG